MAKLYRVLNIMSAIRLIGLEKKKKKLPVIKFQGLFVCSCLSISLSGFCLWAISHTWTDQIHLTLREYYL